MNLWEAALWTWLRSLLIAGCALPVVARLNRDMDNVAVGVRRWVWGALLLPLLTPGFLVGYAYGRGVLALREWEWWNEFFYLLLSMARWIPLGLLIVRLAPPGVLSQRGMHSLKLARSHEPWWRRRLKDWSVWLRYADGKKYLLAFAVLFLATFHDFDLAALLGVQSWNVWLFDAQGAGIGLEDSLIRLIGPLMLQLATLAPVVWLAGGNWITPTESGENRSGRHGKPIFLWAWMVIATFGGCLIPWGLVSYEGAPGFAASMRQGNQWRGLAQEAGNGLVAGITSAVFACLLARWMFSSSHKNRSSAPRRLLILPGLFGPLAVALATLRVFESRWIASLAPSGLSWLTALVVWLIPLGVLISLGLRNLSVPMAEHLASLLRRSSNPEHVRAGWRIWWKLRGDEWLWTLLPLIWLSYFDLAISSILAPPGAVSAPVRLFNQMHYGHSAMLSALTAGAVLVPVGLLVLLLGVRRLALREGIR